QTDRRRLAARVAMDVGQAFLGDAEERDFDVAWQPSYVISIDEVDGDAAARGEAIAEPPQGGGEAGIVQERRGEDVGERADIPERLLHQGLALGDLPIRHGIGSLFAAP